MTRTCVYAVGVMGLLCASAIANAAITFTNIYVQQNYYQTGGTTYVDLMSSPLAALSTSLGANGPGGNAKIQFAVGVNAPTDFTSITVSGSGFASPQALGAPVLNEHGGYEADYIDFGFSSLAALNAKYPLGNTYTFTATASNPALSQTRTNTYDANHQPTSSPGGPPVVPLLTAASYASLQRLNAASTNILAFNAPFFGDASTNLEFAIFDLATNSVFESGQIPATTTSLLLPANTLAADTHYVFALGYHVFTNHDEFENFTFGEFRTAASPVSAPSNVFVDLALFRPSTGQFFIRSSLNGSVTAIQFGAPGDHGLLCRWFSNTINGGDNLMLFRNGVWLVNYAGNGATVNNSFAYGSPTDQALCGNFGGSQLSDVGLFRNGMWFVGASSTPSFFFGQGGDVPVYIGARGLGNATDRRNVVYGVYRAGTWFIDENGSGAPTEIFNLGGLIQDVPLLIPHWNGFGAYSLAIYRDGTWFIKPDPSGATIVTVQFGAIGDIPLVRGAH